MWERLRKDLENYCIRQLEGRRTFIPQTLCKYRLLRLTFCPLTLKTHTFMYLPIYVVGHYVANFYFPLLLCIHTIIYSILTLCGTIKLTLGTKGIDPHGLPLGSEGFQAFLLRCRFYLVLQAWQNPAKIWCNSSDWLEFFKTSWASS